MNPNDLADLSESTSDTVIRRSIVSNDGHRILVVGTIPEQGVPSIGIHVDAVRIDGSMDTMVALADTLEDVLLEMDDVSVGPPAPCVCGFERPMVCEGRDLNGITKWLVNCPKCKRHTTTSVSKTDVVIGWRQMMEKEKAEETQ